MRRNLPKVELFLGKSISRFPNHVMREHIDSGNNGHLFYAFDASTNSELAFKIVPVDNLPRNSDDQYAYLNEPKKSQPARAPICGAVRRCRPIRWTMLWLRSDWGVCCFCVPLRERQEPSRVYEGAPLRGQLTVR